MKRTNLLHTVVALPVVRRRLTRAKSSSPAAAASVVHSTRTTSSSYRLLRSNNTLGSSFLHKSLRATTAWSSLRRKEARLFSAIQRRSEGDDDDGGSGSDDLTLREYQNVWSHPPPPSPSTTAKTSQFFLEPISEDVRLDRQCRFLLELLQTMYQVSNNSNNIETVTTDRCNVLIQRLLTVTTDKEQQQQQNSNENTDPDFTVWPEESDRGAGAHPKNRDDNSTKASSTSSFDSPSLSYWRRCEFARAILESMELFQPFRQQNRHSRRLLSVPLPVPNHDTYFQVLRMYASKQLNGREGGVLDDDNADRLQQAPLIARSIVTRMERTQELALQPSAMHWNQVLSAYASSGRPQRPLEAATLLYELDTKKLTDESSFSHALRCCMDTSNSHNTNVSSHGRSMQQRQKFAEIAIAVALRVWKGLKQHHEQTLQIAMAPQQQQIRKDHLSDLLGDNSNLNNNNNNSDGVGIGSGIHFQSYHFVHMLRVARNFANFPSSIDAESINQKQFEWLQRHVTECIRYQKVNIHVLLEVIHQAKELSVRSSSDSNTTNTELEWIVKILSKNDEGNTIHNSSSLEGSLQAFQGKRTQADSRSPGRIAKELLRSCPKTWTAKAD